MWSGSPSVTAINHGVDANVEDRVLEDLEAFSNTPLFDLVMQWHVENQSGAKNKCGKVFRW